MNRRWLLASGLSVCVASIAPIVLGQQTAKIFRVGYLSPGPSTADRRRWLAGFRDRLQALGYTDQRLVIEERWADAGKTFDSLVAELMRSNPDVIVAVSGSAVVAAKKATTRVPIIFAAVPDPVGAGIVSQLGRPDANITGVSLGWDAEFVGKWLASLKELLPNAKRLALLWSSPVTTIPILETTASAARRLNMSVESFDIRDMNELDNAFRDMQAKAIDGLFVLSNPFTVSHKERIVALAAQYRIPAFYGNADFVVAGGLIGYSASLGAQIRQAADFVDRILKGARPGDLPVEQPTSFEFAINLRTARSLGLTVPQSILLRADRIIE